MGLENINKIKKEKGLTNEELAEKSGVPLSTLNKITSGATTDPKLGTLQAIAKVLECTIDDFDDVSIKSKKYNFYLESPEQIHIKKYRVLDAHGKEIVDIVLEKEHDRIKQLEQERLKRESQEKETLFAAEEAPQIAEMKVYSQPAAAGIGNYLTDDDDYDLVKFPADEIPSRADFGIRISGESMKPEILDGDIVWVEAMPEIKSGEIGIFILNGDSLCKKLLLKGRTAELISINSKYEPIKICEDDSLRTVGKVLL